MNNTQTDWAAYYAAVYIHHNDMVKKATEHGLADTAQYFKGRANGCRDKAEHMGILREFQENIAEILEQRSWNQ